jgi:hypothetical protein
MSLSPFPHYSEYMHVVVVAGRFIRISSHPKVNSSIIDNKLVYNTYESLKNYTTKNNLK